MATKLDRAGQELSKIDAYLNSIKESDRSINEWARGSALALGVHNIYDGIEGVMLNIANDIDGYVPTSESAAHAARECPCLVVVALGSGWDVCSAGGRYPEG